LTNELVNKIVSLHKFSCLVSLIYQVQMKFQLLKNLIMVSKQVRFVTLDFLKIKLKEDAYFIGIDERASSDLMLVTKGNIFALENKHTKWKWVFSLSCQNGTSYKASFNCRIQ
jgi:penicillin-binding protein-related factor A (putative recombinase)